MDIQKLIKMNSAELQDAISARRKKIKILKTEISLLERLFNSAKSESGDFDEQAKQEEFTYPSL